MKMKRYVIVINGNSVISFDDLKEAEHYAKKYSDYMDIEIVDKETNKVIRRYE